MTVRNKCICLLAATVLICCGNANAEKEQSVSQDTIVVEHTSEDTMQETAVDTVETTMMEVAVNPVVTITGTLKMLLSYYGEGARVEKYTTEKGKVKYRLIPDENADPWIHEYYDLDEEGAHIAFVLILDKPLEVLPYLSDSEAECTEPVVSEIMLKRNSSESGKEFAKKYADKRISATGTLYAPCGGIQNVTETVMDLKKIKVVK